MRLTSKLISNVAGYFSCAVGIIVIVGWVLESPLLTSISPSFEQTKVNAAIAFIFSGLNLIFLQSKVRHRILLVRFLSLVIILIASSSLLQYIIGKDLGIDRIFFPDSDLYVGAIIPGRIAPTTSFNLILLGISFFVFTTGWNFSRLIILSSISFTSSISFISCIGYISGITELTGSALFMQMPLIASVLIIVLSFGFIYAADLRIAIISNLEDKLLIAFSFVLSVIIYITILIILGTQSLKLYTITYEKTRVIKEIYQSLEKYTDELKSLEDTSLIEKTSTHFLNKSQLVNRIHSLLIELKNVGEKFSIPKAYNEELEKLLKEKVDNSKILLDRAAGGSIRIDELNALSADTRNLTEAIKIKFVAINKELDFELQALKRKETKLTDRILQMILLSTLIPIIILTFTFINTKKALSEKRKSEEKLKRYASEIQDLYDNAPSGYHSLDSNGCFVKINDTELKWLGYDKDEIIGKKKFGDIITFESKEKFKKNFPVFLERGEIYNLEFEMIRKDGSIFPVLLNATAQKDPDGKFLFSRSTVIDITVEKRIANELRNLNNMLKQREELLSMANKELEAFSYSVSHDLRAPLRHIRSFIQLFQSNSKDRLDEKSNHYLNVISNAAKQMGILIDDLLHFSRMGRTSLSITELDMNNIVNYILEEVTNESTEKNIEWQISNLPKAFGDLSMIRIVWMNLITNAIKYTSKRDKPIIKIDYNTNENEIIFLISDNGAGFDNNYAEKLFGVFQRLHSSEDYEGSGIGLATVRRIISRHGGKTWAEGEVDKGATFYFSLPKKQEKGVNHEKV
jgi:PAS domain S-box-containing protein